MNLKKFKSEHGQDLYINADHVQLIEKDDVEPEELTLISLVCNEYVTVRGNLQKVYNILMGVEDE